MTDTIRWGILGGGRIATMFCDDLALLDDQVAVAVGSRTNGAAFAERHGIARVHATYEALVTDAEVDVVYVATPHALHHAAALLALEAGKHVLVEKPFTLDAVQARELVAAAGSHGVFLMEAMWTRFLPCAVTIRELLDEARLGELVAVHANLGMSFEVDAASRLFAPELGGGALLDLGVYPVSFASMVLGTPTHVTAVSDPAFTGVDAQTSMILRDDAGRHAVLSTTLRADTSARATIAGTEARLEVDAPFFRSQGFTVIERDDTPERFERPYEGNGLRFQAIEVARCVREGLQESPVMPWRETVAVMETLDEVRRQIGLHFPG
jgi:predicted dehydrogenase